MRCSRFLALFLAFGMSVSLARAATTGTIQGTTTDASGAAIQDAQVTVVNEATGETRSMATTGSGSFEFLLLPVGTYTLRVEHSGFQTHILSGIGLAVNQVATFNVTLVVGATSSKVEVKADALQVDATSTQVGTVISSRPILDLPLNGRNLYQLVALQPGITTPGAADANNPVFAVRQVGAPLAFSSGGGRLVSNNFMVDGSDTNGILENQAVIRLIPDAVEEFRVITNTFNAEFGRNSGSVVNIITKSGTNEWHGDAFEFFRNDKLNAKNFFEVDRAPYKLNQFGGTVGGPIRKDKTFVFASIQESRQRKGLSGTSQRVFSDPERNGNFSGREANFTGSLTNPLCFPSDVSGASNCFAAGTPYSSIFPGAIIPSSSFDPVSQNIINKFLPRANVGGKFLSATPVEPNDDTQWTLKVDQQLPRNHRLSFFYYFRDNTVTQAGLTPSSVPGFPALTKERDQQFNIADTWVINPSTVNEFRFSYVRQARGTEQNPLKVFSPASVGFVGIKTGEPATFQSLPAISIAGGPIFQNPTFGSGGGIDIGNVFQFADTFSKVLGTHTLKFGPDIRRIRYKQVDPFVFDGFFSFGGFGPNSTGDSFADFVLGLPSTYFQGASTLQDLRSTQFNLYGQDTWKIARNLTLNYGLRWELNTPFIDINNSFDVFRFPAAPGQPAPQSKIFPNAPPGLLFPGDSGVPRGLVNTYYHAFAPRIGLAYSPGWFGANKLVIRTAYGIFYNPIEQSQLNQFNGQPPFGGSSFVSAPGFATPFVNQAGTVLPSPFPFTQPRAGDTVDFNRFLPILAFGNVLPEQPTQYMEQYNLTIEYQVTPSTLIAAGYVGSQGHRLSATFDTNPGNPSLCLQLASQGCGPFAEDANYVGPSGQTIFGTRPAGPISNNGSLEAFSSIFTQRNFASSNYHSLQLRLEQRAKDMQFLASYTLAKSIDNSSGFENLLNPFCFRCDRNRSAFDARHRFVLSYTYDLPVQRLFHPTGIKQKFLDGWEIGGIITYQSGIPVHLVDFGSDNSLTGGFDFEPADRPDIVGPIRTQDPHKSGTALSGVTVPNQFFDPHAFAVEKLGTIGNASHNIFDGPPIYNWDFTAIKRTQFGERFTLEFRSEFFNVFNHSQFFNPNGDISAGDNFGRITAARDPRFVQFGLKLRY